MLLNVVIENIQETIPDGYFVRDFKYRVWWNCYTMHYEHNYTGKAAYIMHRQFNICQSQAKDVKADLTGILGKGVIKFSYMSRPRYEDNTLWIYCEAEHAIFIRDDRALTMLRLVLIENITEFDPEVTIGYYT